MGLHTHAVTNERRCNSKCATKCACSQLEKCWTFHALSYTC